MGDPRKIRSKFSGPSHPWEGARIEEEKKLTYTYGLKNKKEIWKITSKLKSYKHQAKKLAALSTSQSDRERAQLLQSLISYGILDQSSSLDDVLDLPTTIIMERRLQTLVHKKSLARSAKQARQFITHGHIFVNGKKITSPSYLVKIKDEGSITFTPTSKLNDSDHPERAVLEGKPKKDKSKVKKIFVKRLGRGRTPRRERKPQEKPNEKSKGKPKENKKQ